MSATSEGDGKTPSDEQLVVKRFGHCPEHAQWTIQVHSVSPPKPLSSQLQDNEDVLTGFRDLPAEILYEVWKLLDFNSLTNFSYTCREAYRIVKSYAAYREIRTHVPEVLLALHKTDIAALHPLSLIYDALRKSSCACCGNFGAYLFLLTCQRCCFECMKECLRFRLVPVKEAIQALYLSEQIAEKLPQMRLVPGKYRNGLFTTTRLQGARLVSLEHAFQAVLEAQCRSQSIEHRNSKSLRVTYNWRCLKEPNNFYKCKVVTETEHELPPNNSMGMGVIPFPYLEPSGKLESGIWCKGCWCIGQVDFFRNYCESKPNRRIASGLTEEHLRSKIIDVQAKPGLDFFELVCRMESQERMTADFIRHIKVCPCLDFEWEWDKKTTTSLREYLLLNDWKKHSIVEMRRI